MTTVPCRAIDIVEALPQLGDGRHHRLDGEPWVCRSSALALSRWIVDPRMMIDSFRCKCETIRRMATLQPGDVIISPLLPGSSCTTGRYSTV
ncbi:hypothetical protein [Roseiflexus sp.]|uniref:hypothetical protein n=1 Tax=Roseiflexus sp. TaxID=2562120 RepID=UPI00398A7E89